MTMIHQLEQQQEVRVQQKVKNDPLLCDFTDNHMAWCESCQRTCSCIISKDAIYSMDNDKDRQKVRNLFTRKKTEQASIIFVITG